MEPTLAIARRIAAAHPDAMLPCPACAASLKATNLDRHLAEVHQARTFSDVPHALALELSGADRRIFRLLLALLVLWMIGVGLVLPLGAALGLTLAIVVVPIAFAVVVAVGGLLVLAELGRLPARLFLDERRVTLRYALGLLRVEVALPATLEAGSLWGTRPSAIGSQYEHSAGEDVQVGSYLRLTQRGSTITIGSSGGTQLREHWAQQNIRSGPKSRRWDITLDRVGHVKLQYHLAALGILSPA